MLTSSPRGWLMETMDPAPRLRLASSTASRKSVASLAVAYSGFMGGDLHGYGQEAVVIAVDVGLD